MNCYNRLTVLMGILLAAALLRSPAPAFAEFEDLADGADVEGYKVVSLYLDTEENPVGARFLHSNGMNVDVLRVASVPQVSINFGTLPTSDKGEPHTQEHLLLGKGKVGKYLNSLMSMSLAEHTAGTHTELTNYQAYTAADKATFYRLLEKYLEALIRPDYSDEEIRREVANLEVLKDRKSGRLRLEEKGTVYTEMVSTSEKADYVNWYQLTPLLFGEDNPMSRDSGGWPTGIRKLKPGDIRRFHAANYHFGSNMSLIAALPAGYSPREFLSRLNGIMASVEPEAASAVPGCGPGTGAGKPCAAYGKIPPYEPVEGAPIVIGTFPNEDSSLPQSAIFAFKPLREAPPPGKAMEIEILLSVLGGGETSLLYKDLVDPKHRKLDCGATNVGAYFHGEPANAAMIYLTGMPPSSLTEEKLRAVREVITDRIRSVWKARRRSELNKDVNRKARSLLSSARRATLKFIDAPPRFGFRHRGSGIAWQRHLDGLHRAEGFRKPLALTPWFDELDEKLESGKNFWKKVARRAGLDEDPIVSAVRPDKASLAAERKARERRLAEHEKRLAGRYGVKDPQKALARLKTEIDAKTAELEKRDRSIGRPGFVDKVPLTLDEGIEWEEIRLRGSRVVVSRFPSTPFTDLHLYFDLKGLSADELTYLPVLPSLLTELGVTDREGRRLDYVRMRERWRGEIYSLGAGIAGNPRTGRLELHLSASGSSPQENSRALEWLESCLLRAEVSGRTIERLRTVLQESIRDLRQIFQLSEEHWVREAAAAYRYQDDLHWMSAESPFTRLQHLSRVYFRLSGYPDSRTKGMVEKVLDDLVKGAKSGSRDRMASRLGRLAGGAGLPPKLPASRFLKDFGEYLNAELPGLPEESWRLDLERLVAQIKSDLARDPAAEMKRMRALLRRVCAPGNAEAAVTGTPANTRAVLPGLGGLLKSLPAGKRAPGSVKSGKSEIMARLRERHPKLKARPVHVGLVNNNTKTGAIMIAVDGPAYKDFGKEKALDYLTAEVFAGAAPHTFFLQTWSAGLAYSNGVFSSVAAGRRGYYAERCPDLTATMRFVTGLAKTQKLDDRFYVDFALANTFGDYRGADDYSSRGAALRSDVVDGKAPKTVRRFKSGLVKTARAEGALKELRSRLPRVLGSVLVGYGGKVSGGKGAAGFATGPDGILDQYGAFLKENGEADRLIKLYPRDFWFF